MALNIWEAELGRRNLYDFAQITKPNFIPNWFHERYYEKLDQFRKGLIKRLMVFVPPQHGKSQGSTRNLPAQMIGHNPNLKIGIASYSSTKAKKFGREIKRIMLSPEYIQMFPDVRMADGTTDGYQNAANEFEMVGYEGSIKLDGWNGAWTGDPIDVFILDDLYKSQRDARSPAINGSVLDFYNSVAEARLHNDSQVLIVFTRWDSDDLAGYLLKHEEQDWTVVTYPALKVGNPSEDDPREAGEALLPFKHNAAKLNKIKKRDPELFDCLYQQDAQPRSGLLFPKADLKYYDPTDLTDEKLLAMAEFKFFAVDPADTGDDDLSAPFGYLIGDKVYITYVMYTKDGTDITEPELVDAILKRKMNAGVIEGVGAWKLFARSVRDKVQEKYDDCEIRIVGNSKNKHTRILAESATIRNHFLFRSDWETIPQYKRFMDCTHKYLKVQVTSNPSDDAPDSLAEMAKYFQANFGHLF